MPYSNNPHLPQVRMEAYKLVKYQGWSSRQAARHLGFAHNTILNWVKKKPVHGPWGRMVIPTSSCRPHHHPNQLSFGTIQRILELRSERKQCAEIIHWKLKKEGINVSLSSVKRTLKRNGCARFSKWKKWHKYPPRPLAEKPGILVQIDTVLDGATDRRLNVYTLLDVCSRWAFALPVEKINTHCSLSFVKGAQNVSPFSFLTIQSDHGQEFSKWFTKRVNESGLAHRHSRVRTPTDNGHLERFNRTIQEECLRQVPRNLKSWKKEIPEYLEYYNNQRPHMALEMKTPNEVVRSY